MKVFVPPDRLFADLGVSPRWLLPLCGILAAPGQVDAQSIEGRVLEAVSDRALAAVRVLGVHSVLGDSVEVVSDAEGSFVLRLTSAGNWNVSASRLGYRTTYREVEVGVEQAARVTLRLERSGLLLDSVLVFGNAVPLRHLGTWEGFQARYDQRRPVGPTRLFRRGDVAFRSSGDIAAMLRSMGTWRPGSEDPCIFIDGVSRPGWTPEIVMSMSTAQVRGVEYYGNPLDAPLEYREGNGCPILAIWRRR